MASGVGIQTFDEARRTLGVVWRIFLLPKNGVFRQICVV